MCQNAFESKCINEHICHDGCYCADFCIGLVMDILVIKPTFPFPPLYDVESTVGVEQGQFCTLNCARTVCVCFLGHCVEVFVYATVVESVSSFDSFRFSNEICPR